MVPDGIPSRPHYRPSYAALLDVGLIASVIIAYVGAQRRRPSAAAMLDTALAAALGGLIGARQV